MELLRKRAFWVGFGLFGAAAITVVVYLTDPPTNIFSYVFDLAGFVALYLGGLVIMSQFVLPVQTRGDRRQVLEHFLAYGLGVRSPIVFVKDGRLVARKEELKLEGHGVALIDPSSALVLQRESAPAGEPLARAVGPGVAFIRDGERIVAPLDLRKQSRTLPVKALTKDGIEVNATVSVTFGLSLDPPRSSGEDAPTQATLTARNRPARLFDAERAFRAVYGTALGEKQPVPWTDLPAQVAGEVFRNLIAECTLDSLFQPTLAEADVFPFSDFQAKLGQQVKNAPVLRDRGLIVFSAGVSAPKPPREVLNQRVKLWQARWQRAALQRLAAVDSEIVKTLGHWRARAQDQILKDLGSTLAQNPDASRQALMLIMARNLQNAARDPATRRLLTQDQLGTLEALEAWLK
jgi:hypothetical protein